jgi:hypothetical protein
MYQGVQAVLGLIICRLGCGIRENVTPTPKSVIMQLGCSTSQGTRNPAVKLGRFPDFVGARELFSSIDDAHKEALSIFLEAVQARFEDKQRVPEPSQVDDAEGVVNVPDPFSERIQRHNLSMELLGEIQDVNE